MTDDLMGEAGRDAPVRGLPHILARVFGAPLMVAPGKLAALIDALPLVLARRGSSAEGEAPRGATAPPWSFDAETGIGTITLSGVLVRQSGRIAADSTPLMSYDLAARLLGMCSAADPIKAVMLDIDSPGGEAAQVFDFARAIRAFPKPLWARANDDALSAAYALASGAQRIWVTETSQIGSIGVVAVHRDQSAYDAEKGFAYSFIFSGARKIDGNPHQPLSDEARSSMQTEVSRLGGLFQALVAAHRGMKPADIAAMEAGDFFGSAALTAGLADEIGTPADAMAALAASLRTRRLPSMSDNPNPQELPPDPAPPPLPRPVPPPPQPERDDDMRAGAAQAAEVVRLAVAGRSAEAAEIVAMATLAGRPDLAADLIRSGASLEAARASLSAGTASNAGAVFPSMDPNASRAGAEPGPRVPPPITTREAFAARFPSHGG